MNQEEALTAEEVAKLLKVSRGTVYSLKGKGELSSFLVGRKLRFTRKAVQAYIERNQPGCDDQGQAAPSLPTPHISLRASSSAGRTSSWTRSPTT